MTYIPRSRYSWIKQPRGSRRDIRESRVPRRSTSEISPFGRGWTPSQRLEGGMIEPQPQSCRHLTGLGSRSEKLVCSVCRACDTLQIQHSHMCRMRVHITHVTRMYARALPYEEADKPGEPTNLSNTAVFTRYTCRAPVAAILPAFCMKARHSLGIIFVLKHRAK